MERVNIWPTAGRFMKRVLPVVLVSSALTGCVSDVSPASYSVGSVGQVNRVVRGVVISTRTVQIAGTTGLGASSGAVAGAAAGSTIGNSDASSVAGAVGAAVVVGLVGAAIEENATKQTGIEYVVETDTGAVLTLVQGVGDEQINVGERVLVMYGERARLIRAP